MRCIASCTYSSTPNIAAGDRYPMFDTPNACRVGVLICDDHNLVENARATALLGAENLLAPHQTRGCDSVSPRGVNKVDPAIWARRKTDPPACEVELCGRKGCGWLMRWMPSRAHDNGMSLLYADGVGPDDDEIRTGNTMVLDPHGEIIADSRAAGDDMIVADLDASRQPLSSVRRWMRARRPDLYGRSLRARVTRKRR
ncbi:MAG: nitrilase-related carbon-nitrogen hydrolase [bacterium]